MAQTMKKMAYPMVIRILGKATIVTHVLLNGIFEEISP